jgi:murein DD-endopeptidase MepM/ murein hydrolase activator NlpD
MVLAAHPSIASELPVGSGSYSSTQVDSPENGADAPGAFAAAPALGSFRSSLSGESSALYGYVWPVSRRLGDGLLLLNYVDDDLTSGARDYESAPHTYDGHAGTDISLFHFRAMDRGTAVLAGRGGRVLSIIDGNYDRNTSMNGTQANQVTIEDELGVRAMYGHLRNGSITVKAGETVAAGDVIGLIGSSGSSSVPHLHVEFRQGISTLIDPWSGPLNSRTSLWSAQEPYVGFNPLKVMDIGVFTQTSAGGSLSSIPLSKFEERLSQPAVYGAGEPAVAMWFLYQGQAGNPYRVEILRPDGSLFASADGTVSQKQNYAFQFYWWSWGTSRVPSSAYGLWTARVLTNGSVQSTTRFTVGATTRFGPRFYPVAGRSLRVEGSSVSDVMQMSSLGGPVTYRLNNAPSFVTLSGSTVSIPSSAHLPLRTGSFQVIATDSYGSADTMWYHLVDSRAARTVTAVNDDPSPQSSPPAARASLSPAAPNPTSSAARMTFEVPSNVRAEIAVFDVAGRLVRTLLDGKSLLGSGSVTWDARDDRGSPVVSGVYFVKLKTPGSILSRKLILAR